MGKINLSRLKNCMVRAERGEELKIGFFGGSITQGSLATENARRLTIREISPELEGFRADTEEKTGHLDHFKNGWIGKKPGDKITFEVEASCIAVQYKKTIHKPALRARMILDGDETNVILLDANTDQTYNRYALFINAEKLQLYL